MLLDNVRNFPQIMGPEAVISRQLHWRHSEFGIKTSFCNVNMRWLVAFFSIKIKLVTVNSQHGWHGGSNLLEFSAPCPA